MSTHKQIHINHGEKAIYTPTQWNCSDNHVGLRDEIFNSESRPNNSIWDID